MSSKNTFELLYDQLQFESKNLEAFYKQLKKYDDNVAAMKVVRSKLADVLKEIKQELKSATGKEASALTIAKRQIIENDFSLFDAIQDIKGYKAMMVLNQKPLEQLVKDLGREAKKHCPDNWVK